MSKEQQLTEGMAFMEWFGMYLLGTVIAFLLIRFFYKRKRTVIPNLKKVQTTGPKVFAFIIGGSLLLVSCALNAQFGMMLAQAMPEYPTIGKLTAILLGLGNLASIFAIKQSVERAAAGDKRGAWIARGKWFAITCFSLMTASSIFLSLNGQLKHLNVVADAKVALNAAKIKANETKIANGANVPSASTAQYQNLFIQNSNGARVRLTSVCTKNSGWYYSNSSTCRDYRSALANSGQAARNEKLTATNLALGATSIALLESKPPVFRPTFFGAPVDTKWAFFLVAVFMEIAAEVCLAYAFAKPKTRPLPNQGNKGMGTTGAFLKSHTSVPKGTSASVSGGAGGEVKKPKPIETTNKPEPFVMNEPKPELRGGKSAAIKALPNPFNNSVLEDELDDLLYQLAVTNPQTKVTTREINQIISDHRGGNGVKPARITAAFRRNSDVVLVKDQGGRAEFILRNVTGGMGNGASSTATAAPAVSTLSGLPRA